ncbi:MAG: AmmeMemoRadiSam system radical SAM enzyme [Promethearchaeota archaeon]
MESIHKNFIRKAKYQKKIDKNTLQCLTCERRCKISEGTLGHCKTRYNYKGYIYTIVYGCNAGMSINPIEKKPLFHFFPGSKALTIGSFGCNFDCFWCQNHHMSHPNRKIIDIMSSYEAFISPERFIEIAIKNKCQGTSISFNEPTLLFEYSLEVFKLAHDKGLYNTYVSNGYMSKEVLKDLFNAGLDAMNIDIKGPSYSVRKFCGADAELVWRNAKLAKELGIHVEITTLLIEGINSDDDVIEKISKRILSELGKYTPFHLTRFFPHYKSDHHGIDQPTSIDLLYNAHNIAKRVGLKFVYLGNLIDSEYEDTICPNCAEMVIKRSGFGIQQLSIDVDGNCKYCGFPICIR